MNRRAGEALHRGTKRRRDFGPAGAGGVMGFFGGDKLIIGYDLGREHAQISFAASQDGTVETLSQVAGEEKFSIPTALCKRYGANQWLYGREAQRLAGENQGVLVENLLELALDGEPVIVDGESFDPVALLALFFKRSLGNLKVASMVITCPMLDHRVIEVLGQVAGGMELRADKLYYQSYSESFYTYMLRQPEELWLHRSVLFEYRADGVKAYLMECNRRTRPMVVSVEEREYLFSDYGYFAGAGYEELDQAFCRIAEEACSGGPVGSVYLIGEEFGEDWMKNSLRFLCRGRRVFQGSNLFSKGACWGMLEKLEPSEAGKNHVFLGKDKLKANIGMDILRQGEESYCALLDAGVNWYQAEQSIEIYIQGGNELELTVTPLIGGRAVGAASENGGRKVRMVLEGLPETAARIRLRLFLESEKILVAEAEDLGFGQFRMPSGGVWREAIDIYEAMR